jgi:hypothetical protein
MAYIVWTKQYTAADEGSILYAVNLGSLQTDIAAVINGGITDINISPTAAIAGSKVSGVTGTTYTRSFVNADLVAGVLTVVHNMGIQYFSATVYDNNNKIVMPDELTSSTINQALLDLSSYGTLTGTWNLRFSV